MEAAIFSHYKTGIERLDDNNWAVIHALDKVIETYSLTYPAKAISHLHKAATILGLVLTEQDTDMLTANYPYRTPHVMSHAVLIGELADVIERVERGSMYMSIYMVINTWQRKFLDHIDHYDMQWAEFVKRKTMH